MSLSLHPPSESPPSSWSTGALLALAAVVVAGGLLGWLTRGDALTVYGDDSIYLTLSHSLAAGHYRDEFLIGAPPHAQYPPGMPLYLLLVRAVAGPGIGAIMTANILTIIAGALLAADAARRLVGPELGVAVAAIVMFNPALFRLSAEIRSELPYLAWCALALWCALRSREDHRRWFPALALGAALAAFLTRSAGLALVPAVWLGLALQRQRRSAVLGGIVAATTVAGWFAYTRWATGHTIGHSYASDLAGGVAVTDPVHFLRHVLANARDYLSSFAAVQFAIPDIHGMPIDNVVAGGLILAPMLVGMWILRRRWPALAGFLLLTALLLGLFPWPVGRLVTVMLPWIAIAALVGWQRIALAMHAERPQRVAVAAGAILAGFGFSGQVRAADIRNGCRTAAPFADSRCYQPQDQAYMMAIRFIRDSLPVNAVVAASKPAIVYSISDRKTFPLELLSAASTPRLLSPRGPVTHVLLARLIPYEYSLVAPGLSAMCESLTVMFRGTSGTLLLRPRAPGDTGACPELADYLAVPPPGGEEP
ncbi:MAG: glycosyltransferase family 39 protein [Gemmatimonadota bacterium]